MFTLVCTMLLLSEWTVVTIRVNSHCYQSEQSLLSEWTVITIRVNCHYYQSELSLLSEWTVITIRVNSHYYQSDQSLILRRLMSYIYIYMEHPFLMFLDHTQRRSTVGRTPLDEWPTRRRDLYLTTHDTHNRQISMPPVGFEPTISAGERQGPSPAEILGSNPTGGMDICLLWVSCVVR